MAARSVKIGEHEVEPKMTVLSARRLEQSLGIRPDQMEAAVEEGRFQTAAGMSALAWAVVAHHPQLGKLSEDEFAGQLDMDDLTALMTAFRPDKEDVGALPPRQARGRKKVAARRAK